VYSPRRHIPREKYLVLVQELPVLMNPHNSLCEGSSGLIPYEGNAFQFQKEQVSCEAQISINFTRCLDNTKTTVAATMFFFVQRPGLRIWSLRG
jgi:hypothetical protein